MVIYLCKLCHNAFTSDTLAKKCESRGIPQSEIKTGRWVRHYGYYENIYGLVTELSVRKKMNIRDPNDEISPHELVYIVSPNISGFPVHEKSMYSYDEREQVVLAQECTALTEKEVTAIQLIIKTVKADGPICLHSIERLCKHL